MPQSVRRKKLIRLREGAELGTCACISDETRRLPGSSNSNSSSSNSSSSRVKATTTTTTATTKTATTTTTKTRKIGRPDLERRTLMASDQRSERKHQGSTTFPALSLPLPPTFPAPFPPSSSYTRLHRHRLTHFLTNTNACTHKYTHTHARARTHT